MNYYGLLTKEGEIINKVKCSNLSEAINNFAIIKQLSELELLNIYIVTPIKE